MKKWFEVDVKGFKALYANKSKKYIINELVQNAWDEDITECKVNFSLSMNEKILTITVEDDSPEGFKNITHAYTLFADTYKRRDPTKRGRYNLGEKQVIAICKKAIVKTTKGTIIFDEYGRDDTDEKRNYGSKIILELEATFEDYKELTEHAKTLLVPQNIKYIVDGVRIYPQPIFKTFKATLPTEILHGEILKAHMRETEINLVESTGQSYIYEMGIPILKTDCPWHIDIQQKVQLGIDRDNIRPSYVQDLYAEVVNNVYNHITEPSALWVRTAMKDTRITKEAVKGIMKKRFGDKFCIANPLDHKAMGEAIANGFKTIFGGEMSKEEWSIVKDKIEIESASQMFGDNNFALAEVVKPNKQQMETALYAKRIADRILGIKVDVKFIKANGTSTAADYDRVNRILRFNVGRLPSDFFDKPISSHTTDLIIHEIAHEEGTHTDRTYLDLCTKLGAELTMLALKEPQFFEVN